MLLRPTNVAAKHGRCLASQIKETAEKFVEKLKGEGKSTGDGSKSTAKAAPGVPTENILVAIDPEGNIIFALESDASAEEIASTMAEHITHYKRQNAGDHPLA